MEPTYDPSPAEIEAATAAIRRGWSEEERDRRAQGYHGRHWPAARRQHWQPPVIELTPEVAAQMEVR